MFGAGPHRPKTSAADMEGEQGVPHLVDSSGWFPAPTKATIVTKNRWVITTPTPTPSPTSRV